MDTSTHQITDRIINQAMPADGVFASENFADDKKIEVSTLLGAGMAGVTMRFIFNFNNGWIQRQQSLPQDSDGFLVQAGSTLRNGLIVIFS